MYKTTVGICVILILAGCGGGGLRAFTQSSVSQTSTSATLASSPLTTGTYRLPDGTIFFTNGQGEYCAFANWNEFLLLGGSARLTGVTSLTDSPVTSAMPTCQLPLKLELSVDAFGADPSGQNDSTAAIQTALNAAATAGRPTTVRFGTGTYRLTCANPAGEQCLSIKNANALSLVGQGADQTQLLIGRPVVGVLNVANSVNVTVQGFSVDYQTLPFTQGTILRTYPNENAFDVALAPGYPGLDSPIFGAANLSASFAMDFHPSLPLTKPGVQNYLNLVGVTPNADGSVRVVTTLPGLPGVAGGDRFVLPIRGVPSFAFVSNTGVTFKNVVSYAGPGLASAWVGNDGAILIDDFKVRLKPGTDRLLANSADAIHMADNAALLTIQRCYIEGMGDDAINIRSSALKVTAVDGPRVQFTTSDAFRQVAPGQTLQVVDRATSLAKGTARINAAVGVNNVTTVTLNHAVPGLAVGDVLFDEQFAAPNALITKNLFASFRGHFRIRASGAVFVGNTILNPDNARVLVADDISPLWQEGPTLVGSLNGVYFDGNVVPNGALTVLGTHDANLGAPTLTGPAALLTHPLVFSPEFYRRYYPDLANYDDQAAVAHWLNHGIQEGRRGSVNFLAREYLSLHADLAAAYGSDGYQSAILHYVEAGATLERRLGSIDGNDLVYDVATYPALNPDLAEESTAALGAHCLLYGINEGRRASGPFWSQTYLTRYPTLATTFGPANFAVALKYFVTTGFAAGQVGS